MIMELPLRCRYWSILQVVIIVTCHRGKVSSERAEGCVGSQLSLRCPEKKIIQITSVVLGDSDCRGASCCIKDDDCTHAANENHRRDVHRRCDHKRICTVGVFKEEIPCGYNWWKRWSNNDFERITYNCIDYARNDTMNNSTSEETMEDDNSTDSESGSKIVQGCVGSQLSLICENMTVIEVIRVIIGFGDSNDTGIACNISDSNCTKIANANHTMDVYRRCDDQSNCTVDVIQEDIICGFKNRSSVSDFERITYGCMVDPQSYGTEMAQDCVGSQLNLSCEEMKVIDVMHVVIGDSNSAGTICNVSDSNCTQIANANHTNDVHHRCDGQRFCTVYIIQENISCGWLDSWSKNDFEFITYNCLNDSRSSLTSIDGTVTVTTISYDTEAVSATYEPNSQALTLLTVIICPIILLAIILAVVVMHRRKKRAQMKSRLDSVAMTEVDNHQNEYDNYDIYANETQRTSLHDGNDAQPLYSLIDKDNCLKTDEKQIIYSEVELRETIRNDDGQSDRVTTGKYKATTETHTTKPGVYAVVNKQTGTVSKAPTPQDDGGLTLIENDLYDMTDNSTEEITIEEPTYLLAGAVSTTPSPQDDEGLTVIENDIYCH